MNIGPVDKSNDLNNLFKYYYKRYFIGKQVGM